jgi:putative hydrolases of HD superfamily
MKQLTEKSKFNLSSTTHRCIKMSLVHDIGEAIVGDITPYDGVSEEDKFKLEQEALMKLTNYLKESKICETVSLEIFDLWKEYEENKTKEAIIVKDIDKFDMILQAVSTKESC